MRLFVETLVSGLSLGVIYALIALGFAAIFRATGVLNFAHGAFLLAGAYVVSSVTPDHGFVIGLAAGVFAAALIAFVCDAAIFSRVQGGDHVRMAMITLGINTIVLTELGNRIGTRTIPLGDPWGVDTVTIVGASVPVTRIVALVAASLLVAALFAALRTGDWGLTIRAATQDREAAMLMGIRPGRVSAWAWVIGGALAAVAGVFLSVFPTPGVHTAVSHSALKAFPAAVLGGLDSLGGAVIGGVVIGLAEAYVLAYGGRVDFVSAGFANVVPYIILTAVLLVRPNGLFGRADLHRV